MSSDVLDEHLMIRNRIQEAYKHVIFSADHDFAQDADYKKTSQIVYARLKKLEDFHESDRPRTVQDVIPRSHLAKYGTYLYDEGREMSYTANVAGVHLHYPCAYKSHVIKEPWMLPEVEQVFMLNMFSGSENFKLYEADLEQLDKIDLWENIGCCSSDMHQANHLPFPVFERTPGRTFMWGGDREEDVELPYPLHFNANSYEEALLKNRMFLDTVRDLWNTPEEDRRNVFRIYKSTLGSFLVDRFKCSDEIKGAQTQNNLQDLVKSILELNNLTKTSHIEDEQEKELTKPDTLTPPVRRLYSDVVQGNKSPIKIQNTDLHSTTSTKPITEELSSSPVAQKAHSSHISLNNSPSSPNLSPDKCGSAPEIVKKLEIESEKIEKIPSLSSVKYSYSDAVNNIHSTSTTTTTATYQVNQNIFGNDYPGTMYEGGYNRNNYFNQSQYLYGTGGYRLGNYMNYTNPNRVNMNLNTFQQQQQYFVPTTYRPPNLCNYGNYLGQLFLPQVSTNKPRWSNPQYSRPTQHQQNVYHQNYGYVQHVYRSTSNQQMPGYPNYDTKNKPRKANTNISPNNSSRSKTPDRLAAKNKNTYFASKKSNSTTSPIKILSKSSNSDFKLLNRHEDNKLSSPLQQMEANIPVSLSSSDELEKIALREYQSSNDLFFTEIERQAQEQYDGNPENLCCPPNNKRLCLGGLIFRVEITDAPRIILLRFLYVEMFI